MLISSAHADLVQLRIELFAYDVHADRIWELRPNLATYDAWYVAVAEALGAPLVTLDERVARAAGPTCEFRLLPSA
jgi:predicted nucleic acid-binding protein